MKTREGILSVVSVGMFCECCVNSAAPCTSKIHPVLLRSSLFASTAGPQTMRAVNSH